MVRVFYENLNFIPYLIFPMCSDMKVALIGHSYVKDLSHLNINKILLSDNTQVSLDFTFSAG